MVAHALEGIAEPATVDNKATSEGIASGFVANKFYVHINRVGVNLEDNLNNYSASPYATRSFELSEIRTLLSGKET